MQGWKNFPEIEKFSSQPLFYKGEINMYNNYYQPNLPQTANYQQPPRQITTPIGLKGRPVSSIDEARATSIDFDGSVFYFPDLANRCIYTKQINLVGTATLLMYELKEIPVTEQPNFVTREEFENTITQLKNLLNTAQSNSQTDNKQEFKF